MLRCWRPEAHQHGDRTPSVGIQRRANRAKCFVCDPKRLSTIDLVQSVLGIDTFDALCWLDHEFGPLPRIAKGTHLMRRERASWRGPVGLGGRLEPLVRSGLLAELSDSQTRLLVVFDTFCDHHTHDCTISYAALRRFAGISKDDTVSKALRGLEQLHVIAIDRGRGGHGLSQCSRYMLTLEHTALLAILRGYTENTRAEIDAERRLRAERRKRLVTSRHRETLHTTGINLSLSEGSGSAAPTPIQQECEDSIFIEGAIP